MEWIRQRALRKRLTKSQWTVLAVGVVLLLFGLPLLSHQSDPAHVLGRYSLRFFGVVALWIVVGAALVVVALKLRPAAASGSIIAIVSVGATLLGLEIAIRLTSNQLMDVTTISRFGKAYSLYRPLTYQDELLGTRLVPGSRYIQNIEGFSEGPFNSMSWRDVEHAFEKPPGVFRILVLGDSFVEATHVNLEDAFYRVLDRRLNEASDRRFEVITLGQSNSGTATQFVSLEREGIRYSPDLVISGFFYANEVRDNSIDVFGRIHERARPFFTLDQNNELEFHDEYLKLNLSRHLAKHSTGIWAKYKTRIVAVTRRSIVLTLVRERILDIADKAEGLVEDEDNGGSDDRTGEDVLPPEHPWNVFRPSFDEAGPETRRIWDDATDVTRALYLKMNELSGQYGASFLVVMIGMGPLTERRVTARWPFLDLERPNQLFGSFFAERDITYLDLVKPFRDSYTATGVHYYGFETGDKLFGRGHWNERGHEFAAEEIFRFLIESGVVPLEQARSGPSPPS